jgi:hypothetical protein
MTGRFWHSYGTAAKQFALGVVGLALITFAARVPGLQPDAISFFI